MNIYPITTKFLSTKENLIEVPFNQLGKVMKTRNNLKVIP